MTEGIDVSQWNGTIDWGRVAASGVRFAFIRVSDGVQYPDTAFRRNWEGARDAGLYRGAYQFFRPGQDVAAQADLMLEELGRLDPGELPPALDVEPGRSTGDDDGLAPSERGEAVRRWVRRVTRPLLGGVRAPVIYTSPSYWTGNVASADPGAPCPLWVAHWGVSRPTVPRPWRSWTFWQYDNTGAVPGIRGEVDLCRYAGGELALRQLAAGADLTSAATAAGATAIAFAALTLSKGGAP